MRGKSQEDPWTPEPGEVIESGTIERAIERIRKIGRWDHLKVSKPPTETVEGLEDPEERPINPDESGARDYVRVINRVKELEIRDGGNRN